MRYLIDGYNLLFALGLASRATPSTGFRFAREKMLHWIARHHPGPESVLVIFDAREAPQSDHPEQVIHGLHVRFSVGRDADDLLEELIRAEAVPAQLTVISDDHRIQRAGARRGTVVWSCGEFIDWLVDRPEPPTSNEPSPPPEKPENVSDEELEFWLREFGE